MGTDIIVVIGFIIALMFICKIFNLLMMAQYKKIKSNGLKLTYGCYMNNMKKLELAGAGGDENGDYEVSKAIKKIKLSDDVRIKIDE